MVMMEVFLAGDVSIDFPSERATCRDARAIGHKLFEGPAAYRVHSFSCERFLKLV